MAPVVPQNIMRKNASFAVKVWHLQTKRAAKINLLALFATSMIFLSTYPRFLIRYGFSIPNIYFLHIIAILLPHVGQEDDYFGL
jgi:hypothetical protein